jgi:uncharacterized membrane protein YgcG
VRRAPAAIAGALLACACTAQVPQAAEQQPEPATLARAAAEDCLSRRAEGDPAAVEALRAALENATAPGRVEQVATVAGEQPARVVDRAQVLDSQVERAIAARSRALEATTTDQLVVVTVPDLGGLSIEEFGLALGNSWGIGRADFDNGVLLLVAPRERRVRVEVGCGLEAVLTDARAAAIVDKMTPLFLKGQFERGVELGFGEVETLLRARPERQYGL